MKNGCEDKLLWPNNGKITAGSRNTGQQQYEGHDTNYCYVWH